MMLLLTFLSLLTHFTLPTFAQLTSNTTIPSVKLGYLPVPGASLYYETFGTSGPLLLCISGANGNADIWRQFAGLLQSNYTVAIYDRRGFSRSYLSSTEPQDYNNRLNVDVDDAMRLVAHLAPNRTQEVVVLGTSSGAIVAMQFALRNGNQVGTIVVHEPPAIKILPDAINLEAGQRDIYNTYRASGIPPALLKFVTLYNGGIGSSGAGSAGFTMDPRLSPYINGNNQVWFERELLPYPLQDFDLEALGMYKDKFVLANGNLTDPEALQFRTNILMAERFGLGITMLPGDHVGYSTSAAAFAGALGEVLEERQNAAKIA